MVDELLAVAEQKYREGKAALQAGRPADGLVALHDGLEALLRWGLIRDGADATRASDPTQVTWQDLVTYLDARHGIPRAACSFLSQATYLHHQTRAGAAPLIPAEYTAAYEKLVTGLYRRFFPRSTTERTVVAQRAAFGRPQAIDALTAMPPERAYDTRVVVPAPLDPARATKPVAATPDVSPPAPVAPPVTYAPASAAAPAPAPAHPAAAAPTDPVRPAAAPARTPPPADAAPAPSRAPTAGDRVVRLDALEAPVRPPADTRDAAQQQQAVSAGQRLRAMRLAGLEYCPRCRNAVPLTSAICPQCGYDLDAYRAAVAPPSAGRAPAPAGVLGAISRRLGVRR